MTRTVGTILQSLLGKLPVGWAYGKRGGVLDTLLTGVAEVVGDAEASAAALMDEVDPRNAERLIEDYERVLGPDRCGRDLGDLTLSQRQALAHQRWTAAGGQHIGYLIETAAKVGEDVEVFEFWSSRAGAFRAGRRLIGDGAQFDFLVRLPVDGFVTKFRTGVGRAGQRLGTFNLSASECEIRRIRPAHTLAVFSYVDFLTLDGEPLMLDGEGLCLGA